MPPLNANEATMTEAVVSSCHNSKGEQPQVQAQKPRRRRRRVHFAASVDVLEVTHLDDMSEQERFDVWYEPEDFDAIKRSMIITLRLMIAQKPIDNEHQCTRGLEFRTPAGSRARKKKKLDALTAVWNEQVAQWDNYVRDDEGIRAAYQLFAVPSREEARRVGMLDQDVVQDEIDKQRAATKELADAFAHMCVSAPSENQGDNKNTGTFTRPTLTKTSSRSTQSTSMSSLSSTGSSLRSVLVVTNDSSSNDNKHQTSGVATPHTHCSGSSQQTRTRRSSLVPSAA